MEVKLLQWFSLQMSSLQFNKGSPVAFKKNWDVLPLHKNVQKKLREVGVLK